MSEQQIFAKCAWRLLPFMVLLYVVSFIDRVNVGFAALTMNKDLGFSPAVYGLGAGLFFVSYALFQVPANVILARVGAQRWVFLIMATWGILSAACALVQDSASFYALRFLLGVAEAGYAPGMIFYLTLWFPQAHRVRFTAVFYIGVPLAFIIGGPLSGLILGMEGIAHLHGWQWLFLLEGLPALLLALAVFRFLPDGPRDASWLSSAEKKAIGELLAAEDTVKRRELWPALRDPRVLALGAVVFGVDTGIYGITLWLPQIVQGMGFSNFATGFVVALLYILSMPAMIFWGRSSDQKRERIWHVALPAMLAAVGFVVASLAQSDLLVLAALSAAMFGLMAALAPMLSLPSLFLSGTAAAGGIALCNTLGSFGMDAHWANGSNMCVRKTRANITTVGTPPFRLRTNQIFEPTPMPVKETGSSRRRVRMSDFTLESGRSAAV
jgi:MFS transporter, ACS family, tartrate transporter